MRFLEQLELSRCPHCNVHTPQLASRAHFETANHSKENLRIWRAYVCQTCGGVVTAWAHRQAPDTVMDYFPRGQISDESIPERSKSYLDQALECLHAPAGSVMLCASSVDSMLKEKGYNDGNLYSRIDAAAADHLITPEMASWAHEIRLDANDQRHADDSAPLPTHNDAKRCVEFAIALAEFLFVLPGRVNSGRQSDP